MSDTVSAPELSAMLGAVAAPTFIQTNLISDSTATPATKTDPNLSNPWGLAFSATSPFWIVDHATGLASVDSVSGATVTTNVIPAVTIPGTGAGPSSPTGAVSNSFPTAFMLPNGAAASFIFVTEDGTIAGWNQAAGATAITVVPAGTTTPPTTTPPTDTGPIDMTGPVAGPDDTGTPPPDDTGTPPPDDTGTPPDETGTDMTIAPPEDTGTDMVGAAGDPAVYKGLAIGMSASGPTLYAANFGAGTVDMFDSTFKPIKSFTDTTVPAGYAPFNVQVLGDKLYVTYALQDAPKHDDVAGLGNGFVDAFDLNGTMLGRVGSNGTLDSPWGLAIAPKTFGAFAGDLLVGNFGDGKINVFDQNTKTFLGQLTTAAGTPMAIDDLWALAPGNGAMGGDVNTIYFTAGPDGVHGLFGSIIAAPPTA